MSKKDAFGSMAGSYDFHSVPVYVLIHDSILEAVKKATERGKKFPVEERESVSDQSKVLRILVDAALGVVATELGLWEKVNEKMQMIIQNHPYLIEQLGEPQDEEDSMELHETLLGWLGDHAYIREWQQAIMDGKGSATIPRRPLPGEGFGRIDMIDGKNGYSRG